MPKQDKMGHKVSSNTIEFMLCWPAAPGYAACLECSYTTPLAPWLGMGAHVAWTRAGPVCAVTVSGWHVHQPCCTWKALSLQSPVASASYGLTASFFTQIPEPRGEGSDEVIPLKTKCSKALCPLHTVQSLVSALVTICYRKRLWGAQARHWLLSI